MTYFKHLVLCGLKFTTAVKFQRCSRHRATVLKSLTHITYVTLLSVTECENKLVLLKTFIPHVWWVPRQLTFKQCYWHERRWFSLSVSLYWQLWWKIDTQPWCTCASCPRSLQFTENKYSSLFSTFFLNYVIYLVL